MTEFYYDIKERSCDFQGAIQKLIPGIVISKVQNPDILGNVSLSKSDYSSFAPSPSNGLLYQTFKDEKHGKVSSTSKFEEKNLDPEIIQVSNMEEEANNQKIETEAMDEDMILEDLNQSTTNRQSYSEENSIEYSLPEEIMDKFKTDESNNIVRSKRKMKKTSFLTAKQIEERQNQVLTKEEPRKWKSEPVILSKEIEENDESHESIFDYTSVRKTSSMPMDEEGIGIYDTINRALEKLKHSQSEETEKISAKDS